MPRNDKRKIADPERFTNYLIFSKKKEKILKNNLTPKLWTWKLMRSRLWCQCRLREDTELASLMSIVASVSWGLKAELPAPSVIISWWDKYFHFDQDLVIPSRTFISLTFCTKEKFSFYIKNFWKCQDFTNCKFIFGSKSMEYLI